MIRSFKTRSLRELWEKGSSNKIDKRMQARILRRLDALSRAATLEDLDVPGFNFHPLRGFKPTRYSLHVNGPWCTTFGFKDGDAAHVDLEQYH